jgi:hypothetical protein
MCPVCKVQCGRCLAVDLVAVMIEVRATIGLEEVEAAASDYAVDILLRVIKDAEWEQDCC